MIIECKNILACMFDPSLRYKPTLDILENFVSNALRIVKHDSSYVRIHSEAQNNIKIVDDRFFSN